MARPLPKTNAPAFANTQKMFADDVIVTCTPEKKPFLDVQHAPPGTFIAAVGADSGRVPARQSDDQLFVFDSTGTALQAVVVAALAMERAADRKIGLEWQPRVPPGSPDQ